MYHHKALLRTVCGAIEIRTGADYNSGLYSALYVGMLKLGPIRIVCDTEHSVWKYQLGDLVTHLVLPPARKVCGTLCSVPKPDVKSLVPAPDMAKTVFEVVYLAPELGLAGTVQFVIGAPNLGSIQYDSTVHSTPEPGKIVCK